MNHLETLEAMILKRLCETKLTLAVAESCTGGALAARITCVPGASRCFKGGIVAYSLEAKENLLHVQRKVLVHFGAVSIEAAEAMAKGAIQCFNADLGLSTTGIAGPQSDERNTPVGTVFIGIADRNEQCIVKAFQFSGSRGEIIEQTALEAMRSIYEFTKRQDDK